MFKHSWIWNKRKAGNIFLAETQPMKIHEDVLIFSKNTPNYYPIKTQRNEWKRSKNYGTGETMGGNKISESKLYEHIDKYPESIIDISNASQKDKFHPTQKPVALFEYLIKTYTKESDLVLDNCSGSGTTAIACHNLNRNFICIEKDVDYYNASVERLNNAKAQMRLF